MGFKFQSYAMVHVTSKGTAKIYSSSSAIGSGYDDFMSGYHVSTFVLPTHAVLIKSPFIVGRTQTATTSSIPAVRRWPAWRIRKERSPPVCP